MEKIFTLWGVMPQDIANGYESVLAEDVPASKLADIKQKATQAGCTKLRAVEFVMPTAEGLANQWKGVA